MRHILPFVSRLCSIVLLLLYVALNVSAQSTYVPLNEDYYHLIDRYEVKSGRLSPTLFTSVKPYPRSDIVSFSDSLYSQGIFDSKQDRFNYAYLHGDSWEWSHAADTESERPILRHFYKQRSDLYSVRSEDFDLHVNPVLYVGLGQDSRSEEGLFVNTRGVEVRGMIDNAVGFYTYLTDNQILFPTYVMEYNGLVPHEGFFKRYKDGNAVDFLQARGYITFKATKHINFQFGHDRMFVGSGYRSLVFSDFSPPFLFLKGNAKIWKFNYLFQVGQMTADVRGKNGFPQKYNAFHHLSINLGKKVNVGIFESVVFSPDDSTGTDHFRFDYLNPIIFYRAVEQQNGSTDNVLLGIDFKWHVVSNLSLYGQFMLDEMVIANVRARNGWWANKYGIQGGAKYVDAFGITNLDLQGEINLVRPFTYSHFTNYGSYSHYRQPLAHSLGANFKEVVGIVRYQPFPRVNVVGKAFIADIGRDSTNTVNWGGDILKNNQTREMDFGNSFGQGTLNRIVYGDITLSYHFKHNVVIDFSYLYRDSKADLTVYSNTSSVLSLAVRWNVAKRLYDF